MKHFVPGIMGKEDMGFQMVRLYLLSIPLTVYAVASACGSWYHLNRDA
jgi:hypothetical protein